MTDASPNPGRSQRVLVLGGTGSIGGAVAKVLAQRGHQVTCLARSRESEQRLRKLNFNILTGDIRSPQAWIEKATDFDAVIQSAITWSDDMGDVDHHLITLLLDLLSSEDCSKTLIYTGGCWIYGDTRGTVATEQTPCSPIHAFNWEIETGKRVCTHSGVRGMVIHPAMVYERDGGVLEPMLIDVKSRGEVRIIGSADISWTMVHRRDLAELYALVLEHGTQGETYNASGIESVDVGLLASTLVKRFKLSSEPVIMTIDEAVSRFGEWASGYALDQKMSSKKAQSELCWLPQHTDIVADIG